MDDPETKYDFIKNKTCPYCQSKIKQGADFIVCSNCGTPHHKECWNENLGCTTYGCTNNPLTEKKVTVDSQDVGNETVESLRASLRTSHTQNLIECQNCKSKIEEGSTYCKYCGFNVIENKIPEDRKADAKKEFEKEFKKRYKDKISVTRKRLLITAGSFTFLIAVIAFLFYLTVNKLNSYFSSEDYKIENIVYNWKDAWEDKDLERYKSFLTEDYTYFGKDGKKIDLKEKLKRIEFTFKNYKKIEIDISDFKMINDSTTSESDKKVQFRENYVSEKFKENGIKTLRLYKGEETGGEWKIYREIFE
ncbi:MAG: DUF4440 domain-containing protein [Ignavibacteria bacterium]|nr:DUF4440 domain-containing protein [Ignavibacteria bacterium]